MTELVPISPSIALPSLIAAVGNRAGMRFLEFFAANIRNSHTRRAYGRAVADFKTWCEDHGMPSISNCANLFRYALI